MSDVEAVSRSQESQGTRSEPSMVPLLLCLRKRLEIAADAEPRAVAAIDGERQV